MIVQIVSILLSAISLIYILSYYFLLFKRLPKRKKECDFKSLTVIIPARNEEKYIADCIESVQNATFPTKKQIIVIDDASIDKTYDVAKKYPILLLRNKSHEGKSSSLNKALKKATGELVAIVDGDSIIRKDSLMYLKQELETKNTAACAAVVLVRNKTSFINAWVHIELLYNNLIRSLFAKIGANVVTPGALSMYRHDALKKVDGFSTSGFSEDLDISVRLARIGYHVSFCDNAVSETIMPAQVKGFYRQRSRLARGLVFALRRHMKVNSTIIDLYTLPLFLFIYIQAIIMGFITIYQLAAGYSQYFVSHGEYFSFAVLKFFFMWFSLFGFVDWMKSLILGIAPLDTLAIIGVTSALLTYPLFFYSIYKYDRKLHIVHLAVLFMFPYWLLLMIFNITGISDIFSSNQYNRWKKNE